MRLSSRAVEATAVADKEQAGPLLGLALSFLQSAWEHDILNIEAARGLLNFAERTESFGLPLHKDVRTLAETVTRLWQAGDEAVYEELMQDGDEDKLIAYLEQSAARNPGSGHRARQAWYAAFHFDMWEWYASFLSGVGALGDDRLQQLFLGRVLGRLGRCEEAVEAMGGFYDSVLFPSLSMEKAYWLRLSSAGEALGLMQDIRKRYPWMSNTHLVLHDCVKGLSEGRAEPKGSTAVLIYSYNKAPYLRDTLKSLFGSRLHGAKVIVLNNGSSDDTAEVLREWQGKVGGDALQLVDLPVNIGAPAARNWLKALPEVRRAEFCVYLDDDVLLPRDWLERLFFAAQVYPEAGNWGCRVHHVKPSSMLQCADLHLLPTLTEGSVFDLSEAHLNAQDLGQFHYIRPACHVIGCCHLFKASRLMESGDFDIRFSPSQMDDIDHDIVLCEQGRFPVVNGHLAIGHAMATGFYVTKTRSQLSGSKGNAAKLHTKYSLEYMKEMHAKWGELLLSDMEQKQNELLERGFERP
jgi:hypothetical protein